MDPLISPFSSDGTPGLGAIRRILIVEDNFFAATEFEETLSQAGYEVLGIATTATEAVGACHSDRLPDLILMDVRLAGNSDGVTAAIEIFTRYGVRSVFVTSNVDQSTRERAKAAKPMGWIPKPVTGEEILRFLKCLGTELD
jgi:CheY-like chemotaxis protein